MVRQVNRMAEEELIILARKAQKNAYAPFSKFRVGVALVADDMQVFVGCNVENSSYGATCCAERTALYTAIAKGVKKFKKLVIVTDSDDPTMPCGICRQALWEFSPNLEVVSVSKTGKIKRTKLEDLLPQAFKL